jgi:SAM-dependent methyltransferase
MTFAASPSPFLELVLQAEQLGLLPFLENKFGYNALQIDRFGLTNFLTNVSIPNKFYYGLNGLIVDKEYAGIIAGDLSDLAIQSATIDLAVVVHALENLEDKNQQLFLEELFRILIPEGNLFIIGFNPFSYAGLAHLLRVDEKIIGRDIDFVPVFRLKKWLKDIGFTVIDYKTVFFRLPFAQKRVLKKLEFMEAMGQVFAPYFGSAYILHACKRVVNLTPVKEIIVRKHSPVTNPSV